jgi:hypothetical protein
MTYTGATNVLDRVATVDSVEEAASSAPHSLRSAPKRGCQNHPEGHNQMPRKTSLITLTAAALVAISIAACSGAVAGGPGLSPVPATPVPASPAPATPAPATPEPTGAPAEPTPVVTPEPVDPGNDDDMPVKVDLDNETGHDVYVDIVDRSDRVVGASSGNPGDGATVPPYEVKVENIDERTIRLTWSDIPGDNALALFIDEDGTGLILVQPEHDGDSMPFDRILVLEYDGPIDADDLRVTLQDGLDTPG